MKFLYLSVILKIIIISFIRNIYALGILNKEHIDIEDNFTDLEMNFIEKNKVKIIEKFISNKEYWNDLDSKITLPQYSESENTIINKFLNVYQKEIINLIKLLYIQDKYSNGNELEKNNENYYNKKNIHSTLRASNIEEKILLEKNKTIHVNQAMKNQLILAKLGSKVLKKVFCKVSKKIFSGKVNKSVNNNVTGILKNIKKNKTEHMLYKRIKFLDLTKNFDEAIFNSLDSPKLAPNPDIELKKLINETLFCPDYCSNNGYCLDGQCFCKPGYKGADCSRRTTFLDCINNCSGENGKCDEEGFCICKAEYSGIDCSLKSIKRLVIK